MQALEAFRSMSARLSSNPINSLGLFNKVDKLAGGGADPWPVAEPLASDQAKVLRRVVSDVVPVVGLLAETTEAGRLTAADCEALRQLAALPQGERQVLLASVDLFANRECPVPREAAGAAAAPARPVRHRLRHRPAGRPAAAGHRRAGPAAVRRRPGSRGCGRPSTRRSGGAPTRSRPAGRCPAWRRSPATPSARTTGSCCATRSSGCCSSPSTTGCGCWRWRSWSPPARWSCPTTMEQELTRLALSTDPQWILRPAGRRHRPAGQGRAGGRDPLAGVRGGRRQPGPVPGCAGGPPWLLPAVPAGARAGGGSADDHHRQPRRRAGQAARQRRRRRRWRSCARSTRTPPPTSTRCAAAR